MEIGKCSHHALQDAVAQCEVCNKPICSDCRDMYGVDYGPFAGEILCYSCTIGLIALNAKEADKFRKKTKLKWIMIAVGSILGLIVGALNNDPNSFFLGWWLGIGIGGNLGLTLSEMAKSYKNESGDFSDKMSALGGVAILWLLVGLITGPIVPLVRVFQNVKQMKQCEKIVASEEETLRMLEDYFVYTQTIEKQKTVDLGKLTAQGGSLANNTYARAVLDTGEAAAQTKLRNSVVQIAANGEIIRNFEKRKGEVA